MGKGRQSAPTGRCPLCTELKTLCESHLLARAFLKRMPDAVTLTTDAASKTSRQVTDYVLCQKCDQRLAKYGEEYVISQCADLRGNRLRFPLLQRAVQRLPPLDSRSFGLFEGRVMGVPVEMLGHFALGMIWRSAIRAWPVPIRPYCTVKLEIGPWEERLRRYLLGVDPFPADVCVWAMLAADINSQRSCNFPAPSFNGQNVFGLSALGISFKVWLGDVPPAIGEYCCVNSSEGRIYISNRAHEQAKYDASLSQSRAAARAAMSKS